MIFRHPITSDGRRFKLGADAMATLDRFRQIAPESLEASGLMIGRILESDHRVVDEITVPAGTDERSRFGCTMQDLSHFRRLSDVWDETNGHSGLLGHWHTHPEPDPTPSSIDLDDWNRRLIEDVYNDFLLFVIVGTEKTRMWYGSRDGGIITMDQLS